MRCHPLFPSFLSMPKNEITLFFCHSDAVNHVSETSCSHSRDENFALLFRNVEAQYAKKAGALAFSYNQNFIEDADTPRGLGMKTGDRIKCLEILRLAIVNPNSGTRYFTVNSSDLSLEFSALFGAYAKDVEMDPDNLRFTLDGIELASNERIVETLRSIGPSEEGFLISAMPKSSPQIEHRQPTLRVIDSLVPTSAAEFTVNGGTPEDMISRFRLDMLRADANWLSALICSWPSPYPKQDDAEIMLNFSRHFATWRDRNAALWRQESAETFLARQLNTILSLEKSYQDWRTGSLASWNVHHELSTSAPQRTSGTRNTTLETVIRSNARQRMLREAKIIWMLGSLCEAWKTHLFSGMALLSNGPGVDSDLLIMERCRAAFAEQDGSATVEELMALRQNPLETGETSAVDLTDLLGQVAEDTISETDVSLVVEESPLKRRESARLKRKLNQLDEPVQLLADSISQGDNLEETVEDPPQLRLSARLKQKRAKSDALEAVVESLVQDEETEHEEEAEDVPPPAIMALRPPPLQTRVWSLPARVRRTRRDIIQHEWNKVAREAGAAKIEFVNDIDDEELPPGIGILFPYIERSFLFDIGIPEPSPLTGCSCHGKKGCDKKRGCSCRKKLGCGPAYTRVGLFMFNTDSEIIECNAACECSSKCINRVAQLPRQLPVQIFKTDKRGWGVKIPVRIEKGRVLGLYTGLLIRREEADKLSGTRASYCFDLDVNEEPDKEPPENAYSVDAYACGNWTRFLNHSCDPNLKIISVVYDSMPEDNMPYPALVATKNIPAFTELTFDYNPAHQTEYELKKYREKAHAKRSKSKKMSRCLCGASQCRGWLSVVA
ncbi:SET-domain-containing protein [Favolaschia claudopus]|uniref:SET-domain-containing protein n=1 Tax=Favolaschia claudopus TaxID=2862362 RepID=A0AAV9ZVQ0_9AGAR